jgi:AcrR family transcriptional regulator
MLNVAPGSPEGGFDAVQMRAVAAEADVALGTLYRYFPSKEYLLVSAMLRQIETLAERLAVSPPRGDDPLGRVVDVLGRANRALQRQQQFTIAVVRALVSGDETVAPVVRQVRSLMSSMILAAWSRTRPNGRNSSQSCCRRSGSRRWWPGSPAWRRRHRSPRSSPPPPVYCSAATDPDDVVVRDGRTDAVDRGGGT